MPQTRTISYCVTFLFFIALVVSSNASVPGVSTYPTVSANPIVADETSQYTVSVKISDGSGYNDIICIRVLFNFTEASGDGSKGRGYMAWGTSDATITKYGSTWVLSDANEGRWGYCTDNWGGTTYIQPLSCSVVNSGKATGGTGYRTVTWTFLAKPAWAADPIVNDADVWAEDAAGNRIGWRDNPEEFYVVGEPCTTQAAAPSAPIVANPTVTTVQVAINPADSDSDVYCIRISPGYDQNEFVQQDGKLGKMPVWQTKAQWGTVTVTELVGGVPYSFTARAWNSAAGVCPSAFGGSATITTLTESHSVNAAAPGQKMHIELTGNSTILGMKPAAWAKMWDVLYDTCVRGLAGGLDADTYNWKDMSGQGVGHTGTPGADVPTTLDWMRLVRDHRATPLVTANCRGIGPLSASGYGRFYYTDTSIDTVKKLAADWVRYINFILPTYREGDTLPPQDQAILDSINWYGRPKLLSPGEPSTPKVVYWEIGNEPEVPLPWSTPDVPKISLDGPAYKERYKEIAAAMLAVDPTIKIGPCMLTPNPTLATLDAVLSDHNLPVDFISYHPYGPLYWAAMATGDTTASAESGLRRVKSQAQTAHSNVISSISRCGRNPADIQTIASEYNPSDWKWECSSQIRRVSHALGLAETLFTFAESGMFAATYWSSPAWCQDGTETPGYKVFQMMQQHWGEKLVDSYSDGLNFRMYTTWSPKTQDVCVWAINFSEDYDKPIHISLNGVGPVSNITQKRLQKLTGTTSLFSTNDPPATNPPAVDWVATDLTGTISPPEFNITFPRATLTLLVFHLANQSIAQAKLSPTPTLAVMEDKVVSGVFADCAYIQEPERTCGIRMLGSFPLQVGDVVRLAGRTTLDGKEAALTDVTILGVVHTDPPRPVFVTNKYAGGSSKGLQPGTIDCADRPENKGKWSSGLNPIGILVKTTGTVTFVDQPLESFIYVDDGSNLKDGSGHVGIRVSLANGPVPSVGANAVLTGCCGAVEVAGNCARFLRPRGADDVFYDQVLSYLRNAGFETGFFEPWICQGAGAAVQTNGWKSLYAHSGSKFVGVYAYNSCSSGVLLQKVAVPSGDYRASVWSRVFHTGTLENSAMNRIGVDPTGGTDPTSPDVVWSAWDSTPTSQITPWRQISAPVVYVTHTCTVFLEYLQQNPSYAHINLFDDVELSKS